MTITAEIKPEVEFDQNAYDVVDAYRHEDGAITYIVYDDSGSCESPRSHDGNVAVMIQCNSRCIDMDTDDAGLSEARDRWGWLDDRGFFGYMPKSYDTPARRALFRHDRDTMMQRYVAIFRPDIKHYVDHWSAGDSYGWGYITTGEWNAVMYRQPPEGATDEEKLAWVDEEPSCTPEEAFDGEVSIYRQWANGEVYGAYHVSVGEPIVVLGEQGAYVDGYTTTEDSCWGFLGYDEHADICDNFTNSPITEVLY